MHRATWLEREESFAFKNNATSFCTCCRSVQSPCQCVCPQSMTGRPRFVRQMRLKWSRSTQLDLHIGQCKRKFTKRVCNMVIWFAIAWYCASWFIRTKVVFDSSLRCCFTHVMCRPISYSVPGSVHTCHRRTDPAFSANMFFPSACFCTRTRCTLECSFK